MNNQNTSVIPDENKIKELLGKIQPMPSEGFHRKMKQTPWLAKQNHPRLASLRMRLAVAMVVVVILAALAATPQGRAWAQEAVQFFKQVNFTTMPLSEKEVEQWNAAPESYDLPLIPVIIPAPPSEMLALPGCETAEKAQSYFCQIAYAESQVGFDILELPEKLKELEFYSVTYDKDTKTSIIEYGQFGIGLRITQRLGEAPQQLSRWDWVPARKVNKIKVGKFDGEYVSGSFILPTNGTELVWTDDISTQRVAWSDGKFWYLVESNIWSFEPGYIKRDQLIELSASLVKTSPAQDDEIDPNALSSIVYSISDAEKISGLDLKAPTILPMHTGFSYASYDVSNSEVRLYYGANDELIVHEWTGEPIDFHQPSDTYEIVHVNGKEAYFGSFENADPYLFLWWHQDGLNYQLYYYQYFGVIDRKKMIIIAESMQNIDDFRTKGKKDYAQINIYEQALGIEIKKFSEAPDGWIYNDFWGNSLAQCIDLIYTSKTGGGTLYIDQCKTDRNFDISNVPRQFTDRVRLRNTKGIYIVGGYVTDNNGKKLWDPAAPIKQLYWQEDKLWVQVTISGNSALQNTKEDLIAIAESLQ